MTPEEAQLQMNVCKEEIESLNNFDTQNNIWVRNLILKRIIELNYEMIKYKTIILNQNEA